MKLFLLVALTMTAFAANSILNRIGVADYGMAPMGFATIRVAAGALMLWALVIARRGPLPDLISRKRAYGAIALAIYMIGFSWAYLTLGAGLGALILFGVLQMVVFGWAVWEGQAIPSVRRIGAAIALVGLCVLLWPTGALTVPFGGAVAMIAAAVGWAAYTLLGRGEGDALGATAGNFLICLPIVALAMILQGTGSYSVPGVLSAVMAGAVTSGLGYALWYRVLPKLQTTIAGISQLSVPVIAVGAGVLLLDEPLTRRLLMSSALVLGGIAVSLIPRK